MRNQKSGRPASSQRTCLLPQLLRSSQTGTLQTGTLKIRGKPLERRHWGREREENAGPLWQKQPTYRSSEKCASLFALKLKVPVSKVPVREPFSFWDAEPYTMSCFHTQEKVRPLASASLCGFRRHPVRRRCPLRLCCDMRWRWWAHHGRENTCKQGQHCR